MKGGFVELNQGLSREEKDTRLFNEFWEDAAKLFNSTDKDLLEFPGLEMEVYRFEILGLSTATTELVVTAINVKSMTLGNGNGAITLPSRSSWRPRSSRSLRRARARAHGIRFSRRTCGA